MMNASMHSLAILGCVSSFALVALTGCHPSEGGSTAVPRAGLPSEGTIAQVPLSDFAGIAESTTASSIANPYAGQPAAVEDGKRLFVKLNCAGCHLYSGKGSMGPDLTDQYWRYGGAPVNIFKSIYEGRPHGMPAWGRALPADDIWKLVAYINSLGKGVVAPDEYQAMLQGDRPGEQVAPEVAEAMKAENASSAGAATDIAEIAKSATQAPDANAPKAATQSASSSSQNGGTPSPSSSSSTPTKP